MKNGFEFAKSFDMQEAIDNLDDAMTLIDEAVTALMQAAE